MAERLPIDLTDPDDIAAKLPDVERLVREKEADFQEWDRLADRLARIAGVKRKNRRTRTRRSTASARGASDSHAKPPSSQKQVVKLINEAKAPLRVGEVYEALGGTITRDTVSWALWNAEQEDEIQRVRKGVYASLDFNPESVEPRLNGGSARGDKK